jgi:hypothetical protein
MSGKFTRALLAHQIFFKGIREGRGTSDGLGGFWDIRTTGLKLVENSFQERSP